MLLVVLLAAGCTQGKEEGQEFVPPRDQAACVHRASSTGSEDASSIWRLAIDDTSHPLDDPIAVYVCYAQDQAAEVMVSELEGVSVSPEELRIAGGESAPVSFKVSLTGDGGGYMKITLLDIENSGGDVGVYAEVDGDEWSLRSAF